MANKEWYEVKAYYGGLTGARSARRKTVDGCHEWLRENKTMSYASGQCAWDEANMTRFKITKSVMSTEVVEEREVAPDSFPPTSIHGGCADQQHTPEEYLLPNSPR